MSLPFSHLIRVFALAAFTLSLVPSQRAAEAQAPSRPAPTYANAAYGPHERNVLDFWMAKADRAAPLAIFIHGGGFSGGSKEKLVVRDLQELLDAGISVAALNYRYVQQAKLPAAHQDVARAVQFLRCQSAAWHIDKTRCGGFGGSAGAQLVMYLAFHDDIADPSSSDPICRESSRLTCVAPQGGQASMGMDWWDANIPHYTNKCTHRLPTIAEWNVKWYGTPDAVAAAKIVTDISAISLLSRDDPPVFMTYGMPPEGTLPAKAQDVDNWILHHVAHGLALKQRCDQLGIEVHLKYPGAKPRYPSGIEFLKAKLLAR